MSKHNEATNYASVKGPTASPRSGLSPIRVAANEPAPTPVGEREPASHRPVDIQHQELLSPSEKRSRRRVVSRSFSPPHESKLQTSLGMKKWQMISNGVFGTRRINFGSKKA